MSFGLKAGGRQGSNEINVPVAEVLQLAHLLERKPKALSGGQRQRSDWPHAGGGAACVFAG